MKKTVKAWAVVQGSRTIDEYVAFGSGCMVFIGKVTGIYPTRKQANELKDRWRNGGDFDVVPCTITYSLPTKRKKA